MSFEYLFTALPPLPKNPGGKVGLNPSQLAEMCQGEDEGVADLATALLFEFDLRAMERVRLGVAPGETAMLTEDEIKSDEGLPVWLKQALSDKGADKGAGYEFDRAWRAYFARLMEVALARGSSFLARWACFDAGLRQAIASHRASQQKAEAPSCDLGGACGDVPYNYRRVIDELIAIRDHGGEYWKDMDRYVAQVRLEWVRGMSQEYAFDLDELISYIVQFTVLRQSAYLE